MEEKAADVCAICQNHYVDEDDSPKLVTIPCRNSDCAGTLIHENIITPLQCLNCRVSNLIIPLRYPFDTPPIPLFHNYS